MIPTLYDKTGNNKIGDLNDCIECLVEEERNKLADYKEKYATVEARLTQLQK